MPLGRFEEWWVGTIHPTERGNLNLWLLVIVPLTLAAIVSALRQKFLACVIAILIMGAISVFPHVERIQYDLYAAGGAIFSFVIQLGVFILGNGLIYWVHTRRRR
jgi:hypothetical protein